MLQVRSLAKAYGAAPILTDISCVINDTDRVGLIGPNGAGKSTLLRCITGAERPDAGSIARTPPDLRIGHLAQVFDAGLAPTVGETIAAAHASWSAALAATEAAASALGVATAAHLDAALADYDATLTQFETLGGYDREQRAAAVLDGLGLGHTAPETPTAALSGGQKTRLALAALLLGEPQLLLLDEPTNHLDLDAIAWLESFVRGYPGAVLVVSHDRDFLNRTVSRIFALDARTRTLRSYTGNYDAYVAARAHEQELHAEAYLRQQEYVDKVTTDIKRLKGQALGVELSTTPSQPNVRRYAKKVAAKARARERKLDRYMASDERVEKPRTSWGLRLDFGDAPAGGRAVLAVEDVTFGYPDAPELLHDVTFEVWHGERLAIVGPNGGGKTTLLRLISGELVPHGGRVRLGANVRVGVLAQEQETLDMHATVLATAARERAMTETETRAFLHQFLFAGDAVHLPVAACSPGERARLQLALLVLRGCNLLLLDEPTNHLDIDGREHFEDALEAFNGTVILVAHDRAFVRAVAERAIEVRAGRVRESDPETYGGDDQDA